MSNNLDGFNKNDRIDNGKNDIINSNRNEKLDKQDKQIGLYNDSRLNSVANFLSGQNNFPDIIGKMNQEFGEKKQLIDVKVEKYIESIKKCGVDVVYPKGQGTPEGHNTEAVKGFFIHNLDKLNNKDDRSNFVELVRAVETNDLNGIDIYKNKLEGKFRNPLDNGNIIKEKIPERKKPYAIINEAFSKNNGIFDEIKKQEWAPKGLAVVNVDGSLGYYDYNLFGWMSKNGRKDETGSKNLALAKLIQEKPENVAKALNEAKTDMNRFWNLLSGETINQMEQTEKEYANGFDGLRNLMKEGIKTNTDMKIEGEIEQNQVKVKKAITLEETEKDGVKEKTIVYNNGTKEYKFKQIENNGKKNFFVGEKGEIPMNDNEGKNIFEGHLKMIEDVYSQLRALQLEDGTGFQASIMKSLLKPYGSDKQMEKEILLATNSHIEKQLSEDVRDTA